MEQQELERRVERLERELREKEANLEKAAMIGKSLLEANQELETRNEDLVGECTRQVEVLEQEKYTLQMHLTNKEHMERHHTAEIENLQENLRQEVARVKEHLELEHSREIQKVRSTAEGLRADLELARIQSEQCKEQVKSLEDELQDALSKANTTILDVTSTAEDKLSALQEENISLTAEKMQLTSRLKDLEHELEQLRFTNHTLTGNNEELESRADEEHKQCVAYSRSLQETRTQVEELQAELDLLKLESTDPNKKGNSLFAEVEDKRQALEKKMIGLQLRYDAMQKQLNHKKQQVHGLKYQIAGLLQMDGGRVAASQVERLEELLAGSRSEVQALTQKLHHYQNHATFEPTHEQLDSTANKMDLGLKKIYQSKLDQSKKEKDKVENELQSERMQRMSCEDQLVECQRNLYSSERQVQQLRSNNVILTVKVDELRAKLSEHGITMDREVKGGYKEKIQIPEKYRRKAKETSPGDGKESEKIETDKTDSQTKKTLDQLPLLTKDTEIMESSSAKDDPKKEILSEQNGKASSTHLPKSVVPSKTKTKTVSISDDVMVVDSDGNSTKRSVEEEEEYKENEESSKRTKAMMGDVKDKADANGTVKGRRGRRVVSKVQHISVKDNKNECNQQ